MSMHPKHTLHRCLLFHLKAASSSAAPATNGTPAAKKTNNGKRKSGAGVPEHKKKTPAKSKKKAELRLNAQPGEMYMVAMRGYQPWPVIVCDEEMLPESLLSKRPVSAKRIDGTYREDFLEGGKNAKDRRYPVMFLGTNEL
jgi:malate synthase